MVFKTINVVNSYFVSIGQSKIRKLSTFIAAGLSIREEVGSEQRDDLHKMFFFSPYNLLVCMSMQALISVNNLAYNLFSSNILSVFQQFTQMVICCLFMILRMFFSISSEYQQVPIRFILDKQVLYVQQVLDSCLSQILESLLRN